MQVLLGLQSNALKFTVGGEVHIKVKIEEQFLCIAIQDTGVGISQQNQEKLFKLFGFLEETQVQNKNGVGLGLVISKQIVEQFEGDIKLESEEGVGSTFSFKFKIYPLEDDSYTKSVQEVDIIKKVNYFMSNAKKLEYKWVP